MEGQADAPFFSRCFSTYYGQFLGVFVPVLVLVPVLCVLVAVRPAPLPCCSLPCFHLLREATCHSTRMQTIEQD